MGFTIRPVQRPEPAYPAEADPGVVECTTPARWLARAAILATAVTQMGCPFGVAPMGVMALEDTATWTEGEVLDCEGAREVVLAVYAHEGWQPTDEVRTLWDLQAQHMGEAQVLSKGEAELLVATHDDDTLAAAWAQGAPHACVVIPYAESCDTALCEDEPFGDVCAHLVRVPCLAGAESTYQEAARSILSELPSR